MQHIMALADSLHADSPQGDSFYRVWVKVVLNAMWLIFWFHLFVFLTAHGQVYF